MHKSLVAQFTSLLLILVILAASLVSLCHETRAAQESAGTHAHEACKAKAAAPDDSCPCPSGEHSDADHCASACYCSCHLPVTVQPLQVSHAPVIGRLLACEPFTALPEVYLTKFIPPQNHA